MVGPQHTWRAVIKISWFPLVGDLGRDAGRCWRPGMGVSGAVPSQVGKAAACLGCASQTLPRIKGLLPWAPHPQPPQEQPPPLLLPPCIDSRTSCRDVLPAEPAAVPAPAQVPLTQVSPEEPSAVSAPSLRLRSQPRGLLWPQLRGRLLPEPPQAPQVPPLPAPELRLLRRGQRSAGRGLLLTCMLTLRQATFEETKSKDHPQSALLPPRT
nr:bromodomain-containing protein 4-like [Microcebus murinus]XP_012623107.1 bromodomain-containing protein 4-like [Microcebus murinus]